LYGTTLRGWKKTCLLVNYFFPEHEEPAPGRIGVVEWTPGWEDNFDSLAGRLIVPPVVRSLLYAQDPGSVRAWVDAVTIGEGAFCSNVFARPSVSTFDRVGPFRLTDALVSYGMTLRRVGFREDRARALGRADRGRERGGHSRRVSMARRFFAGSVPGGGHATGAQTHRGRGREDRPRVTSRRTARTAVVRTFASSRVRSFTKLALDFIYKSRRARSDDMTEARVSASFPSFAFSRPRSLAR